MMLACKKKMVNGVCFGEPTEAAIINAGVDNNIYKSNLEREFPRVRRASI